MMMDGETVPVPDEHANTLEERFARRLRLNVPGSKGPKLQRLIERVNADDELYALWTAANVNAIERLGMTDHGPVHVKIVMNIAVKLLDLLMQSGVRPGVVTHYGLENEDAEVVVVLAALLHDVGISIHRMEHEAFSLFVAQPKLKEILEEIYDVRTATVMRSEVLHAIIAHRSDGKPLTVEAGVVRVGDALDMTKGRSRVPVSGSSTSIHAISSLAIEAVHLERGQEKPVRIRIDMNNSAGVFQLDQLFREKLRGSGLEPFIELEALLEAEQEKKIVEVFHL
jgi:uncharacterized protein